MRKREPQEGGGRGEKEGKAGTGGKEGLFRLNDTLVQKNQLETKHNDGLSQTDERYTPSVDKTYTSKYSNLRLYSPLQCK